VALIHSLHASFTRGAGLFDAGRFFDAHEVWEDAWREATDPDARLFFQGMIQIAAAFHKLLVMRSPASAVRLAERGLAKLDRLEGTHHGLDLARFRDEVRVAAAAIALGGLDVSAVPRAPR
jgi:predicted metal-dependent hydrolase